MGVVAAVGGVEFSCPEYGIKLLFALGTGVRLQCFVCAFAFLVRVAYSTGGSLPTHNTQHHKDHTHIYIYIYAFIF